MLLVLSPRTGGRGRFPGTILLALLQRGAAGCSLEMGKDGRVELIPRLSFSFVTGRLSNVIAALLSILLHLIASSVWPPLSLSFSLLATFHEFDRFEKEPLHPVKSSNIRMKRWGGFRMIFNKHPDRTARCTARPLDSRLETAEERGRERERKGERALGRFVYGLNHSMSTKLTDGQALHRTYYVRSTWNKATPLFRAVNNPLGPTWRTGQGAAQLEKAAWKPGNRCPTGVRHPREEKGREGEKKRKGRNIRFRARIEMEEKILFLLFRFWSYPPPFSPQFSQQSEEILEGKKERRRFIFQMGSGRIW